MSKIRALELAVEMWKGSDGKLLPSFVVEQATAFAAFLGEETQVIGGVVGKTRKVKETAAPSASIAANEEQAAAPDTSAQDAVNRAAAEARQKADAAVAAAKASTAARVAQEAAAAVAASTGGVTEADVKAAVGKVATTAAAGGAPKAREVLGRFGGATNISTLKQEFYADAVKALNEVLEAAALAA